MWKAKSARRIPAWNVWDNPANRWDLSCALAFVCALVILALTPGGQSGSRLVGLGCVAGMGLWYALVGHDAIRRNGRDPQPKAVPYVVGLAVLLVAAQSQLPVGLGLAFLLYALNPQFFMAFPPRQALVPAITLNAIPTAFALARDEPRMAGVVAAAGAMGIAHSTIMGNWINQIISESRERHHLIGELNAARAELADAHHREGVLAERQRMAGEIHDTLAQGFSSILMLLQAAEGQAANDPHQADRQLALAARTARENLAEARALVAAGGPTVLDSASLPDAVGRLTEQFGEETGIVAEHRTTGVARRSATDVEVTVVRAVQEALSNIRKHAQATSVAVELTYEPESVRLEVCDDGVGFCPEIGAASGREGGYGLNGMRERVARIGGTLTVSSAFGDGTRLVVEIKE